MKFKYSAEEKFQIVTESFADNVTQAEICRRHGIYPVQLIKWKEQFIHGGKSAVQDICRASGIFQPVSHCL